jgi:competence protein ComEC
MDAIQRKLANLDHVSPWQRLAFFSTQSCPLLLPSLGVIIGILIQNGLALPSYAQFIFLLALIPMVMLTTRSMSMEKRSLCLACTAGLAFACLGGLRLASYSRFQPQDMRALIQDRPRMVCLRGTIDSTPCIDQPNWTFAASYHLDPATSFDLKADCLQAAQGWRPVEALVRVRIAEPVHDLKPGNRIEIYGWLDRFGPPSNPGQFDIAAYLARQNIHLWVSIKSQLGIVMLHPAEGRWFCRLQYALRQRASRALISDLPTDSESRGLLQALILGYRRDISSDVYMAFKKTGLLHFISLSGMHMGILAALVWWICRLAGLLKRGRAAVCALIVMLFMLVVPPRAPTMRAAIICWIFCLSFFFQRRPNSFNTLCLAALVLLLHRPTQVFDAGWQLSFASVLGILILSGPLYEHAVSGLADIAPPRPLAWLLHPVIVHLGRSALSLLCVGLGAWLGGVGILLYHFYRITPLACVWTVVIFPLVAFVLVLGFIKILLFFCLPWMANGIGAVLSLGVKWLVMMVQGIDSLDCTSILVGHTWMGWVLFYYVSFFTIRFVPIQRARRRWILRLGLVVILLAGIGGQRHANQYRDDLLLTCLDVGHGQAVVLQLPGKQNMLFDTGSLYRRDIGRRVVIPFLDYQGINRLDQVMLSHNDTDHINGIPEVVAYCPTDQLCAPIAFDQEDRGGAPPNALKQWLQERKLTLDTLAPTVQSAGDVQIQILWPTDVTETTSLSDNDRSLVTLIQFAGKVILICSDIEQLAQQKLLALYPELAVDVLIAPHHGSLTTLAPSFLAELNPQIVICSCSRSQWKKGRIVQEQGDYRVLCTANHGAVSVRIDASGQLSVRSCLGQGSE